MVTGVYFSAQKICVVVSLVVFVVFVWVCRPSVLYYSKSTCTIPISLVSSHQPPSVRMLPSSLFWRAYLGLVISIPLPLSPAPSGENLALRLDCHLAIAEELLLSRTDDVRPGIFGLGAFSKDPADPVVGVILSLDGALSDCPPPKPLYTEGMMLPGAGETDRQYDGATLRGITRATSSG